MRNSCCVKPRSLLPKALERFVAHLLRARVLEWLDIRLLRDHERVAVGTECGRDHLGNPHPGLRGHQRRQRLVLDLLQAPVRDAPRRIPVGQRAPAAGEPLRVLRIAAKHSNLQRNPACVIPHILHRTAVLPD